jgi:hypothetical protein
LKRDMHRVEYPTAKPTSREVRVHCTDGKGNPQQKVVPLVSLATLILKSVQAPGANRSAPKVERIDWSIKNV